jgi:hypothetical protein
MLSWSFGESCRSDLDEGCTAFLRQVPENVDYGNLPVMTVWAEELTDKHQAETLSRCDLAVLLVERSAQCL